MGRKIADKVGCNNGNETPDLLNIFLKTNTKPITLETDNSLDSRVAELEQQNSFLTEITLNQQTRIAKLEFVMCLSGIVTDKDFCDQGE